VRPKFSSNDGSVFTLLGSLGIGAAVAYCTYGADSA